MLTLIALEDTAFSLAKESYTLIVLVVVGGMLVLLSRVWAPIVRTRLEQERERTKQEVQRTLQQECVQATASMMEQLLKDGRLLLNDIREWWNEREETHRKGDRG